MKSALGRYKVYIIPVTLTLLIFCLQSCENIFSPKLDNSPPSSILTDQKTVSGLFQNFIYSYTFKDTNVYSYLLTDDFVFTYRDYASGFDVSWDKYTDMKTTAGLFLNTQKLELIWNNIIYQSGSDTLQSIKRSFNLTITFNPSDIIRLNGFVDMTLVKFSDGVWKIRRWKDESF